MRFEVPQFIEIEDKIFGPFTWRQFIYLVGGVGMGVTIFLVFGLIPFMLFGAPLGILGFLLAFYPVNNRPFSFYLGAIFSFYKGNRLYKWRKKQVSIYKDRIHTASPTMSSLQGKSEGGINSLARKLELKAIQKDI